MRRQFDLSLLIVCAALSQVIPIISDENIEKSSDLLVRKKRVISNQRQNEEVQYAIRFFRYIVNILEDGRSHCAGIILESDIILTGETCIEPPISASFYILSGSTERTTGSRHNILRDKVFVSASGSVMFKIAPPIQFHRLGNNKIELFTGVLPPYPKARFAGWGLTRQGHGFPFIYPQHLVITSMPLIPHEECSQRLDHDINNHRYICTLDTSMRMATLEGDEGGPLFFQDFLIGVLLHPTTEIGRYPDVFINLMEPHEHQWVISKKNALMAAH